MDKKKVEMAFNAFCKTYAEELDAIMQEKPKGFRPAFMLFDRMIKEDKWLPLICALGQRRGRHICTDEEAAAFVFALETRKLI